MHDSVTGVIGRYVEGRVAYQEHEGQGQAGLKPRKGGPDEVGYPEQAPLPEKEDEAPSLAARAEETP
jgi:hypothetical protein